MRDLTAPVFTECGRLDSGTLVLVIPWPGLLLRVFGESKIFPGAFGARQFRPKNFFGASNNSGPPDGGGGALSPPIWTPPPFEQNSAPPPPPPPPRTVGPAAGPRAWALVKGAGRPERRIERFPPPPPPIPGSATDVLWATGAWHPHRRLRNTRPLVRRDGGMGLRGPQTSSVGGGTDCHQGCP